MNIPDLRPKVEIINGLYRIEVVPGERWLWQDHPHGLAWLSNDPNLVPEIRQFSGEGFVGVEMVDQNGHRLTFRAQATAPPMALDSTDEPDLAAWLREQLDEDESRAIRPLAECDAQRRIIGLVQLDFNDDGEPICLGGYGEAYWDVLRLLALPYAARPGYLEEWCP